MVRQLILVMSLLYVAIITVFAQAPDILWTKTFGGDDYGHGNSVLQTEDDGFLIAGLKDFIPGQLNTGDVWLIRTDSNGDTLWTKTYGDTSGWDEGYSIQQTSDGGFIIAGKTSSYGAGLSDAYLIRVDDNGDTLWTKTYGGESDEYATCVQQTSDGGFILVGHTYSYGFGSSDVWLIRTDENGDTLWTKTFGTPGVDFGNSVQQTSDGGFIATGRIMSFISGAPDLYLIRINSNGDTLWTKSYNGPYFSYSLDEGKDVQQMPDGGFFILGRTDGPVNTTNSSLWLIRTDSNGDTLWTKTYEYMAGNSMQLTTDGGFIITGDTSLIRINDEADTLWTKALGISDDFAYSVQQTSDGGFIVAGRTNNSSSPPDVWLVRVGSDGTTSAENNSTLPAQYELFQNYPNPFNPITNISWHSPLSSWQTLKIYDVLGNIVATLVEDYRPAGLNEVEFDASKLPSGIYFYRLNIDNKQSIVKKMTLIK
jgi:hypothetical protein